jgi:hypothetical protein
MDVKFLISIEGNTRSDRCRNEIFSEEVGIQHLLTQLEEEMTTMI